MEGFARGNSFFVFKKTVTTPSRPGTIVNGKNPERAAGATNVREPFVAGGTSNGFHRNRRPSASNKAISNEYPRYAHDVWRLVLTLDVG
jgi:hypothetical protein